MLAAKKYQVKKEAKMDFRIVFTVTLGGGGKIVAWFVYGPRQSEVQASVEGLAG
jgi:hypothetical protein